MGARMHQQGGKYSIALHSFVCALFFVLIEGIKAYRSSQWSGTTAWDLGGIAAGLALYAVLLALLGGGLPWGAARLWKREFLASAPVAGTLAGLVVWGCLSPYREFAPTLDDAVVAGGLAALGFSAWLGRRALGMGGAEIAAILSTALLCGCTALYASGLYWLFEPDRARWVTVVPLAAAGIAGGLAIGLRSIPGLRMPWVRVAWSLLLVAAPVIACRGATWRSTRASADAQPNLVFVVADTLRAKSLALHGGPIPSPALDAMAARGHVFERAYSLAPWTLPSMTSLFGSDYPPSLTPGASGEVWTQQLWQYAVQPDRETLAEKLRARGYATGAFTANAFLPVVPGLMEGFDTRASAHPILLLPQGLFNHLPFLQDALLAWAPALANLRPHDTTRDLAHYSEAFLQRNRNRPFYLWVHYIDPHAPYDPPAAYRTRTGAWPFFHPYTGGERWGIPILGHNYTVPEADRDYVASLYDGEVRYIDEFIGRLNGAIVENGLAENTYVCVTSDHGEELWERGDWGHGQSLYDELVHVPLLITGPGIPAGRTGAPVSAVDLTPTLADFVAAAPEPGWKGVSQRAAIEGRAALAPRPVFMQGTSNKAWPHPVQAVVDGGFKLMRELDTGAVRLYDLAADPGETADRSAAEPERVAAMAALLDAWMLGFSAVFPVPEGGSPGANTELFDELRGMGYLR
ncbi:MAG: sulfatase [Candidatus Hydrogenedentes bacterium]|nr:sulfatase [Candidatus Hydrogenedentota bacterium]